MPTEALRHVVHHHDTDRGHANAGLPCRIETHRAALATGTFYYGECATHDAGRTDHQPTEAEARLYARCDLGRDWHFTAVHIDDHTPPEIVTISGVWEHLYDMGMTRYTDDIVSCCDDMSFYRFDSGDGTNSPLTAHYARTDTGFRVTLRADTPPTTAVAFPRTVSPADPYSYDGMTYLDEDVVFPPGTDLRPDTD